MSDTLPLRDQAVSMFREWLAGNHSRPWWTIDADEPRIELWAPDRGGRPRRRA